MKYTMTHTLALLVVFALESAVMALAQAPDRGLLALVPPDSQIVGGSLAPYAEHHRVQFLVFARANTLDLQDFFSIAGVDASRAVDEVVFAASGGHEPAHPEHSLLVRGRFDKDRILSALPGAVVGVYRGVAVVSLQPFERERALLQDARLLAIIDSRLAIFGTAPSVRQEIDQYLDGTGADSAVVKEISSLQNQDETWCLISSLALGVEVPRMLKTLDPAFGQMDVTSGRLLFGIRYGRQIEFEYEADLSPSLATSVAFSGPRTTELFQPAKYRSPTSAVESGRRVRRVVRISRAHYQRWLANMVQYNSSPPSN